jgi:hypothetical protein
VVSGTATYASVPNNTISGALDYNATAFKPIRGATVQAISAGAVLASTLLSEQGTYSFALPQNTSYSIRVRAELIQPTGSATWSVSAKDNTNGNALWTVETAAQSSGTTNITRTVAVPSGWTGTSYGTNNLGSRPAAPFAILDTIYTSMKLVSSVQPTIAFPELTVYWSPNNRPLSGSLTLGEIGTSFFTFKSLTSGSNVTVTRSMYILGAADVDTDEYDSSVIAHEYGHYLQSAFSTNHSTGGPHGPLNKLDMTLAFGEGFGNAWSSMSRNNPQYFDSLNFRQGSGGGFDVRNMPLVPGWFSEDSVQSSLYKFFESEGFAPVWAALTGPMRNAQDALASIFSFAAAVRSEGTSKAITALNAILNLQNIFGLDQWGAGESNSGGNPVNLPIYMQMFLGVPAPVCFINTNVTANGVLNKLGSVKYLRITLVSPGPRTITANFPAGRDIDFEVYQNRVLKFKAANISASPEVAGVSLNEGEVVIRAVDYGITAPPVAPNCATITVN